MSSFFKKGFYQTLEEYKLTMFTNVANWGETWTRPNDHKVVWTRPAIQRTNFGNSNFYADIRFQLEKLEILMGISTMFQQSTPIHDFFIHNQKRS